MRITNKGLSTNYLRNLNKNLERMQKYQYQLSAGKEVSRPSDNPLLVSKIMDLRNNILQNEQYNTNIRDSLGWVRTQDGVLDSVSTTLNRIRDLVIYRANGTLSETDRTAIFDELSTKVQELEDTLNTNFDGRYIFAGQKTFTKPFDVVEGRLIYIAAFEEVEENNMVEVDNNGAKDDIEREISKGVTIKLRTNGSNIITANSITSENKDLGILLKKVTDAVKAGDNIEELSGELLSDLDKHIDNILQMRSKIGAIDNRLQAAEDRNNAENLNLNSLLSQREDVDLAEKYMEYSVMRSVYQASLQVGSQILQPSLLDYLR